MSPVIFYSLILGLVEVLQYFLVPFVLKNGTGEPGGTTYFFNLTSTRASSRSSACRTARRWPGCCSCVTLVAHAGPVRLARRWVYYAGER